MKINQTIRNDFGVCAVFAPDGGVSCSLEPFHSGRHRAHELHDMNRRIVTEWRNEQPFKLDPELLELERELR